MTTHGIDPAGAAARLHAEIDTRVARNVILFVGDGMGDNEVTAARNYLLGPGGRFTLDGFLLTGTCTNYSMQRGAETRYNYVTDSAAAATAWATGRKSYNGGIGVDQHGTAAQTLVDAVGHDLRALAGAVSQLVSDGEGGPITEIQVRRYFGGRSEVTSFAVADAALAGRTGVAMEQLRWAVATGVAPVLVTSALASGLRGLGKLLTAGSGLREADLAREVGVPPWKLKSMRSQARGWDQGGLATALKAVAVADAEVKGAAEDAAFALERAVLTVARARRG